MSARIFSWDHDQQPDMKDIAAFVAEISGGRVVMRELETGSQEYAWLVADHEPAAADLRVMAGQHNIVLEESDE
jgi:hypothetical protein